MGNYGFAPDDERLKKNNKLFDRSYFDGLLERIREIWASGRMFYPKLTDMFTQSVDYDRDALMAWEFYVLIRNKLQYPGLVGDGFLRIIDRMICAHSGERNVHRF